MLDALSWIVDFFKMIGEVITNLLASLAQLFAAIAGALTIPTMLTPFLFPALVSSVVVVISISVVKLIVGRQS